MKNLVKNYYLFLRLVEEQFVHAAHRDKAHCLRGCHKCCTGFFGITLLDALHLRENIKKAPPHIRGRIIRTANRQLDLLETKKAFSRNTPLLRSSASADILARGSAGMRCPALGDDDTCLIYANRPFLCRIFGPTVRGKRRTVLLEGCGHFSKDISESDYPILSIYKDEDMLLRSLFAVAGRKRLTYIETIIPAALVLDLEKWL
jgi:Fe-S-cluster containining protein